MTVTFPKGFKSSGIHSGIKEDNKLDLALIYMDEPVSPVAVGVFTSNEAKASPVLVSQLNLEASKNAARAIILNSGNANAGMGKKGFDDASLMVQKVSQSLDLDFRDVLVASTGLIGIPMPIDRIIESIPLLISELSSDWENSAKAILTTDTKEKTATFEGESGFRIGAIAKGAAMLAPALATMLCVVTTDFRSDAQNLDLALKLAVEDSFNSIVVDGCMSTNDTVLLLSSGSEEGSFDEFRSGLGQVLKSLSNQMVKDAEGSTVFANLKVKGAASKEQARTCARQVATSVLVRCSLNGHDPYWGRILSELGAARTGIDQHKVSIFYGETEVARDGAPFAHDAKSLKMYMERDEIEITADLKLGYFEAEITFCDISHAYIDENIGTS